MKKTLEVRVATTSEVASGSEGRVVWTGTDSEAARLRRIAEETANPKLVAWVE